jgi:hypothetical protein
MISMSCSYRGLKSKDYSSIFFFSPWQVLNTSRRVCVQWYNMVNCCWSNRQRWQVVLTLKANLNRQKKKKQHKTKWNTKCQLVSIASGKGKRNLACEFTIELTKWQLKIIFRYELFSLVLFFSLLISLSLSRSVW